MLRFFFLASSNTTIIASATISAALPAVIICFNVFSVGLAHKRSIAFQLLIFYNTTLLLIDWIITKDHNSIGLVMMKNGCLATKPWTQNVLTAQKEFRLTILRLYVYDVHKPIRIGLYSHFLSVYLPKIKSRLTIIIVAGTPVSLSAQSFCPPLILVLQLKVDWNFYYKGIISMLFDSGHSLEMSTSQIFLELGFKEKEDRVARIFYSSVVITRRYCVCFFLPPVSSVLYNAHNKILDWITLAAAQYRRKSKSVFCVRNAQ